LQENNTTPWDSIGNQEDLKVLLANEIVGKRASHKYRNQHNKYGTQSKCSKATTHQVPHIPSIVFGA